MTFDFSILRHFQLPYCNTCYSMQSATITEKYTVFDCNTPYVDRNFIWTALTRATDLKNITIFEHSIEECQVLEESKKKQKITLKIEGYKAQDKQAKRSFKRTKMFSLRNTFLFQCGKWRCRNKYDRGSY